MREIYNFDDEGMSYQNAGAVYAYDSAENKVIEFVVNRSGRKKIIEKKIGIAYLSNNTNSVGDMNNIKMRG